jgi:DNA-binding Lrp family transcriptional regulator
MTSEATSLIGSVKEQIHQMVYPSTELTDMDLLLDNLAVYAKRVTGTPLTEKEQYLQAHRHFGGLVAVPRQSVLESLLRRLQVVLRFRIVSYDKVTRDLLYGLFPKHIEPLTGREVRLLNSLHNQPEASPVMIAKDFGVSVPTVRKLILRLEEKVGLRFAHLVDWRRFKLRQLGICFETKSVEASHQLEQILRNEMATYNTSAVFDATYERGYAGFRIPDQQKPLELFQQQIAALNDVFFETVQVHDAKMSSVTICFDHFDFEAGDWMIERDVMTIGLLNFVEEHFEVLPKPQFLKMKESKPFDQLDYYLATFLLSDGRLRMRSLLNQLKHVGINAPRTTVSTRKNQLLREQTLLPYVVFESPLLPIFVTFAIRCNADVAERLVVAVAQMPFSYAYISEIGCVVHVKVPMKSLGAIIHLLSLVREEEGVEEILQIQQFKNLGSASGTQLGTKWNGKYWNWSEDEFSLPSLGLEY